MSGYWNFAGAAVSPLPAPFSFDCRPATANLSRPLLCETTWRPGDLTTSGLSFLLAGEATPSGSPATLSQLGRSIAPLSQISSYCQVRGHLLWCSFNGSGLVRPPQSKEVLHIFTRLSQVRVRAVPLFPTPSLCKGNITNHPLRRGNKSSFSYWCLDVMQGIS